MNNVIASHYSTMFLPYHCTMQLSPIKHNVYACYISALRLCILISGMLADYKEVWCLYMDGSCGELTAHCFCARHKTERHCFNWSATDPERHLGARR